MAMQEGGFQKFIEYRDSNQTPFLVADETFTNLIWYFSHAPGKNVARDFFAESTLPFIFGARKGFLRHYREIDRANVITPQDDKWLSELAKPHILNPDIEEDERFRYSLVVFSILPAMARSRHLPSGFSRRGLLEPPFTTREFHERLRELGQEFTGIIRGTTKPETPIETRASLWRTFLFFQVAHELPIHIQENPREVAQKTRDTFEHLLGDMSLDLD